jgi:hypothetical protein
MDSAIAMIPYQPSQKQKRSKKCGISHFSLPEFGNERHGTSWNSGFPPPSATRTIMIAIPDGSAPQRILLARGCGSGINAPCIAHGIGNHPDFT